MAVCSWERREKGLELLLPAWEVRERPGKLVVVGGNVATHEVEDVTFIPAMSRDMLMALMGRAAFLIRAIDLVRALRDRGDRGVNAGRPSS